MKARVTLTLDPECVEFLDEMAHHHKMSRSAILEALLKEYQCRCEEEDLAQLAQEFFSKPETREETAERRAWGNLSLEVLSRGEEVD